MCRQHYFPQSGNFDHSVEQERAQSSQDLSHQANFGKHSFYPKTRLEVSFKYVRLSVAVDLPGKIFSFSCRAARRLHQLGGDLFKRVNFVIEQQDAPRSLHRDFRQNGDFRFFFLFRE